MKKTYSRIFKNSISYLILIFSIVCVDQLVKLLVFYNMTPGSAGEIEIIGDFFKLHFIQNPGMAFGIRWGSEYGKLGLSVLRLGITAGLIWYLIKMYKQGSSRILLISLSLIVGGAIGNGIDSTFYGVLLDNAPPNSLSPWLHGKVVDMFYLDIWKGRVGDSVPILGGRYLFLWPIFNIADTAVSVGVMMILVFQGRIQKRSLQI
jgi:signal peptidase II